MGLRSSLTRTPAPRAVLSTHGRVNLVVSAAASGNPGKPGNLSPADINPPSLKVSQPIIVGSTPSTTGAGTGGGNPIGKNSGSGPIVTGGGSSGGYGGSSSGGGGGGSSGSGATPPAPGGWDLTRILWLLGGLTLLGFAYNWARNNVFVVPVAVGEKVTMEVTETKSSVHEVKGAKGSKTETKVKLPSAGEYLAEEKKDLKKAAEATKDAASKASKEAEAALKHATVDPIKGAAHSVKESVHHAVERVETKVEKEKAKAALKAAEAKDAAEAKARQAEKDAAARKAQLEKDAKVAAERVKKEQHDAKVKADKVAAEHKKQVEAEKRKADAAAAAHNRQVAIDKSRAKLEHAGQEAVDTVKSGGRGILGGIRSAARSVGRTLRIVGDKTEAAGVKGANKAEKKLNKVEAPKLTSSGHHATVTVPSTTVKTTTTTSSTTTTDNTAAYATAAGVSLGAALIAAAYYYDKKGGDLKALVPGVLKRGSAGSSVTNPIKKAAVAAEEPKGTPGAKSVQGTGTIVGSEKHGVVVGTY